MAGKKAWSVDETITTQEYTVYTALMMTAVRF